MAQSTVSVGVVLPGRQIRQTMRLIILVCMALVGFAIVGCMPGGGSSGPENRAGFFMGIWQGWIAPVSLTVGFFNSSIRVYEPHNTGWWYDFGFYTAIIAGFGSLGLFRRRVRDQSETT